MPPDPHRTGTLHMLSALCFSLLSHKSPFSLEWHDMSAFPSTQTTLITSIICHGFNNNEIRSTVSCLMPPVHVVVKAGYKSGQ